MQHISDPNYTTILADPAHRKEWQAKINGTVYGEDSLIDGSIRQINQLYGDALIGNACSGQLDLSLRKVDPGDIPRMAKVELEYRLTNSTLQTGGTWVIKNDASGVFATTQISFTSNGQKFTSIGAAYDAGSFVILRYDNGEVAGYDTAGGDVVYEFYNDAYRKLTFDTPPTGDLLTWLQSNATKQPNDTAWIPKGTFWINTREEDPLMNTVTLHCVDAMMFGEQDFIPEDSDLPPWNDETMRTVANMCVQKINASTTGVNVVFDNPNDIQNTAPYILNAPPVGYTVRQILSGIAAAHGGNFIITPQNHLRFIPLIPTDTEVDIQTNVSNFTLSKKYEAFGQVVFNFESDDGSTVSALYPNVDKPDGPVIETKMLGMTNSGYATTIAQNVYNTIKTYLYSPYKASDAILDPAMELGDGLTINGLYTVIAVLDETCDGLYSANIEAPSYEETDYEFVYQTKSDKNLERKLAKSTASMKIGIDSITQMVTGLAKPWISNTSYAVGDIVEHENKFYRCTVSNSDSTFDPDKWTEIDSGVVESILQLAIGKMTLSVNSTAGGSSIELTSGGITIESQRVYFQTDNLHISGKLAASQIETSQLVVGDNIQMGDNATISWNKVTNQPTILGTDDVDGQIATYIDGHSIQASTLKGQYVYIYGSNGRTVYGTIYAGTNSVGTTALELNGNDGLRLTSGGNTYLTGNNGGSILIGYDTSGSGTATLSGVHINGLFCGSWLCMGSGYYGTSDPGSVVSSPKEGMLYFKITS